MNAIILAGGKSSSMYATGATVHKALLPIMGIPNIERTIMMLHDYHISDIIIAVSILNHDFDYLTKKYSCRIEYIPIEGKNTLYTMKYLLHYIQETFVIEGDVVCAQNIFFPSNSSRYYVMNYTITECDAFINCISKVFDENELPFVIKDNNTEIAPALCKAAEKAATIMRIKDYARFDFRMKNGVPYLFDIAGTPYTIHHSSIAYLFTQYYHLPYESIYKVVVACMLSNYDLDT